MYKLKTPNTCGKYRSVFVIEPEDIGKRVEPSMLCGERFNIVYFPTGYKFFDKDVLAFKIQNENVAFMSYMGEEPPIKQPTYRPYANAEEFLKASKEHGPYLKCLQNVYYIPYNVNITVSIHAAKNVWTYKELLENDFKWSDGSVCGILEQ